MRVEVRRGFTRIPDGVAVCFTIDLNERERKVREYGYKKKKDCFEWVQSWERALHKGEVIETCISMQSWILVAPYVTSYEALRTAVERHIKRVDAITRRYTGERGK